MLKYKGYLDENDDKGRPPYPLVEQLSNHEVSASPESLQTKYKYLPVMCSISIAKQVW